MTTRTPNVSQPDSFPPLLAEQLALGELPPQQATSVRARLGSRAEVVVSELHRSDAEIRRDVPVKSIADEVARRRAKQTSKRTRRALWVAVPALACVALLVLRGGEPVPTPETRLSTPHTAPQPPGANGVRLKGFSPHLRLYRRTPGEPEMLTDGSTARAGDVIQISYLAAGRPAGVLLSIDGRGQVTAHLPVPGSTTQAVVLREGSEVFLEDAFELDDAPHFERFMLITAAEPFEVAPILAAVQELAQDATLARSARVKLGEGFEQYSLTLIKRDP
ncbi:MAG: ActD-like protein [Nannocystaceae bacterium]